MTMTNQKGEDIHRSTTKLHSADNVLSELCRCQCMEFTGSTSHSKRSITPTSTQRLPTCVECIAILYYW